MQGWLSGARDWIKQNKILTILLVAVVGILLRLQGVNQELKWASDAFLSLPAPHSAVPLDFTNAGGVTTVQSTFCPVLIASLGSDKKGEGYTVRLKIVNPSSLRLNDPTVTFGWEHNGKHEVANLQKTGLTVIDGGHANIEAFLSPMQGSELKNVDVYVEFETLGSH